MGQLLLLPAPIQPGAFAPDYFAGEIRRLAFRQRAPIQPGAFAPDYMFVSVLFETISPTRQFNRALSLPTTSSMPSPPAITPDVANSRGRFRARLHRNQEIIPLNSAVYFDKARAWRPPRTNRVAVIIIYLPFRRQIA